MNISSKEHVASVAIRVLSQSQKLARVEYKEHDVSTMAGGERTKMRVHGDVQWRKRDFYGNDSGKLLIISGDTITMESMLRVWKLSFVEGKHVVVYATKEQLHPERHVYWFDTLTNIISRFLTPDELA